MKNLLYLINSSKEMVIQEIGVNDLFRIRELASKTWFNTYSDILKEDQLNYMFEMMYNIENLKVNLEDGSKFYILIEGDIDLGFIEVKQNKDSIKLNKIYVTPMSQGKGIGNQLIQKTYQICEKNKCLYIELNVNRFNKAIHFYEKNKFKIVGEVDIEIGNGYLMEDFIMKRYIR